MIADPLVLVELLKVPRRIPAREEDVLADDLENMFVGESKARTPYTGFAAEVTAGNTKVLTSDMEG